MDTQAQDREWQASLEGLTAAQREAVEHREGPLLILAGPGSGKTRVVTHRIANLIWHGVLPHRIVALTFTNKAAEEMRQRVDQLVGSRGVWLGTFHSFCARLLRRYAALVGLQENYSILDADDSKRLMKQVLAASSVPLTHTSPEAIRSAISWAKNSLITHEEYAAQPGSTIGTIVARVYPEYQRALLDANSVDFDDLLLHAAMLLKQNPEIRSTLDDRFEQILVDEYQDTNLAQYAIVRALSIDRPNLGVTGDPDQSIYGWRGANLRNILDFEQDFAQVKVVRLEENFRSTPAILTVADCLISNNVKRKPKRLFTANPDGPPVRLTVFPTERDEAEGIVERIAYGIREANARPRDFAIFYRINALSRQLEHSLRARGIPYQIVNGQEFYQRKEIKDVLAYLHLVNNPQNNVAFDRVVNTPTRGIGKKTLERLTEHAQRYRLSRLEAARESGLVESIPKRTAAKVAAFVAAYDRMQLAAGRSVRDLIEAVLKESGYRESLANSEAEEDLDRLANIEELVTAAEEFDHRHPETDDALEVFLEQSSLVADTDSLETSSDCVTLMTLHAAKGLEFPSVFIIATEEGLLPHERCSEDPDQLEEERRLLFVGITRAERELQLSLVQYRSFRGQRRATIPSQFLMELPRESMQYTEPGGGFGGAGGFGGVYDAEDFDQDEGSDASNAWQDEDFIQEAPEAFAGGLPPGVVPASRLQASRSGRREQAQDTRFRVGSWVTHPDYGEGTVIAVSGRSAKRAVRVLFNDDGRSRSFLVEHSPLVPVED